MCKLIIKEAEPEDANALIEYLKRIGGESDNLTYGAEGMCITLDEERTFLQMMKHDPHSVFVCAWKNRELVGTGSISSLPRRMSHRAELSLSVAKAEWNHGIGTMILKELITYARGNGVEILNLEVRSDNTRAIHLYEKYGFQHIGTFPGFFKIGSQYIDFDLMYLDLK